MKKLLIVLSLFPLFILAESEELSAWDKVMKSTQSNMHPQEDSDIPPPVSPTNRYQFLLPTGDSQVDTTTQMPKREPLPGMSTLSPPSLWEGTPVTREDLPTGTW